jgi:hypothetical protein
MTLEITVATLVAIGYALGAYADEKRERERLVRRHPASRAPSHALRSARSALPSWL